MEIDADSLRQAPAEPSWRITIEQAVGNFLRDEEARKLQKTSTCQSKTLFEKQLLDWERELFNGVSDLEIECFPEASDCRKDIGERLRPLVSAGPRFNVFQFRVVEVQRNVGDVGRHTRWSTLRFDVFCKRS
jgi:hypothetical protein